MNKKITIFTFGLILCNSGFAANWQFVSVGAKNLISVDTNSIATVDGYKKVWVKISYGEEQTVPSTLKKYVEDKELWYLDCRGKRLTVVSNTSYNAAGEVQQSERYNFRPASLQDVIPDSNGEEVLDYVCSGKAEQANKGAKSGQSLRGALKAPSEPKATQM